MSLQLREPMNKCRLGKDTLRSRRREKTKKSEAYNITFLHVKNGITRKMARVAHEVNNPLSGILTYANYYGVGSLGPDRA